MKGLLLKTPDGRTVCAPMSSLLISYSDGILELSFGGPDSANPDIINTYFSKFLDPGDVLSFRCLDLGEKECSAPEHSCDFINPATADMELLERYNRLKDRLVFEGLVSPDGSVSRLL